MVKIRYFAEDGTEHPTLEAAQNHERRHQFADLCKLSEADIDDMLAGVAPHRAAKAEELGNILAKARRERGEFKRAPKKAELSTAETLPSDVEPAPESLSARVDALMAETFAAEREPPFHPVDTVDDFPL